MAVKPAGKPPQASLRGRFGRGIAWNTLSTMSLQGGTFVTNLVVAHLLGAELFGQFGLVIATAQMVAGLLQFSTGMAATKFLSEFRANDPDRAEQVLGLCSRISLSAGIGGTVLLAIFASTIATIGLKAPSLTTMLLLVAPLVMFSILSAFQTGALAGLEGFKSAATTLAVLTVLQIASVALATHQFGLTGAVIAMTANFGLRAWCCHRLVTKEAKALGLRAKSPDKAFARQVFLGFLLPGSLTGLTAMPAMWVANVALSKTTEGFVQVAHMNAAISVRNILMLLPWILSSVALSLLSGHLGREKRGQFQKLLFSNLAITALCVGAGSTAVLLLGNHSLGIYGHDFRAGFPVLKILLISLASEALALPLYQAIASHGQMWRAFFLTLLPRDALILGLSLWWIPEHGAVGFAWAHSVAFTYSLIASAALFGLVHRPATHSPSTASP